MTTEPRTLLNVSECRARFPGLAREVGGRPAAFFDGAAGSQVPDCVIRAVSHYMATCNANTGGVFATSIETGEWVARGLRAAADFLGGDDPDLITFGPSMTALTFSLSHALSRTWGPDDEIVVTRLEHDANFSPWVIAARDAGATVRQVAIHPEDCTLDLDDFRAKVGERTRLVAFCSASNAAGTLNPVRELSDIAHAAGALVFVDAVHSAPHLPVDVEAWDCDFLACSPYKFFGPHMGILWGRRPLLETLPVDKLRPATNALPGRWAWGTENFEGIAGTIAAIDYIADLGRNGESSDRRTALLEAYRRIGIHERQLLVRLLDGLERLKRIRVCGITDRSRLDERVPTVSFTHERLDSKTVAEHLAERGIFAWHGNFYALPVTEALGLEPDGLVRIGLLHYNTEVEVDRLVEALAEIDQD